MKYSILLLVALLFGVSSCNLNTECYGTKSLFLKSHKKMIESSLENDWDRSDKRWEIVDKEIKKMKSECYDVYADDMTMKENRQFLARTIKYEMKRSPARFSNAFKGKNIDGKKISKEIKNAFSEIGKAFEDVDDADVEKGLTELKKGWSNVDKEVTKVLEKIDEEELNELINDMGTDIEGWAKKLEKVFED